MYKHFCRDWMNSPPYLMKYASKLGMTLIPKDWLGYNKKCYASTPNFMPLSTNKTLHA